MLYKMSLGSFPVDGRPGWLLRASFTCPQVGVSRVSGTFSIPASHLHGGQCPALICDPAWSGCAAFDRLDDRGDKDHLCEPCARGPLPELGDNLWRVNIGLWKGV